MFKKPFTQKSSSLLKKADRKVFQSRVKNAFTLEDVVMERILPRKEELTITRILTHQETEVIVYSVYKRPMFFEFYHDQAGKRLVPSVYMLWLYPEMLYRFTVYEGVENYIYKGANVMLPGVVKFVPKVPTTYFQDNQIACINVVGNIAAVAVGLTAMSGDSSMGGQQGKVMTVLHYYTDYLCCLHDLPLLKMLKFVSSADDARSHIQKNVLDASSWPALGESARAEPKEPEPKAPEPEITEADIELESAMQAISLMDPEDIVDDTAASKPSTPAPHIAMDAALHRCFMIVVKYSPTLQLPQLASTFYKKEMVEMFSDQQLDIKASSYKKVSEFLKAMQKDGLCKLGQKQKGVDTVEEINYRHEHIVNFYLTVEYRPSFVEDACVKSTTKIPDSFIVIPEVVDIFLPKYRVGAKISSSVAKSSILDYIKKNGLQDIEKEFTLARTAVLQRLCTPGTTRIPNEELMHTILYVMENCAYKSQCVGCSGTSSGTNQGRIRMQIQMHNGKTVTLVSNLQDFPNVHLSTFVKEIQVIAATSAKVIKDTRQVQAQGNQIEVISSILSKKYGISKSKMIGLELAPKTKKCKH